MVTRNIKANTATQVNANLIGVQVRPEVVPPTYEVNELTANVGVNNFGCINTSNGLPMLYQDSNIWAYTGSQEVYDGTVYNVWSAAFSGINFNLLTDANDTITDQTQFYIHLEDPDAPPVVPVPASDYMLKYTGDLRKFDPNGDYWYVADDSFVQGYLRFEPTCDLVNGFFISKETGEFLGVMTGTTSYSYEEFNCTYRGDDNGYGMWKLDYYTDIYLYSEIRNPYVGYNLISNNVGTEAYTSQVLSVIEDEVDPGYEEGVDCTLSYSVDGSTWTDWPENMTDDNNVISNIPRYMYLKFSQDVVITEE